MEECKICMTVNHLFPITCPGGHKYCLSCIKGLTLSSSPSSSRVPISCPECRFQPARTYIADICNDSAQIQQIDSVELYQKVEEKNYVWLYEGRNNGWWYFDYELQDSLEDAYKDKDEEPEFDWVICGQKITINFNDMEQHNAKNNAVRKVLRIKYDDVKNSGITVKGVAGMMPKK